MIKSNFVMDAAMHVPYGTNNRIVDDEPFSKGYGPYEPAKILTEKRKKIHRWLTYGLPPVVALVFTPWVFDLIVIILVLCGLPPLHGFCLFWAYVWSVFFAWFLTCRK